MKHTEKKTEKTLKLETSYLYANIKNALSYKFWSAFNWN